MAEEKKRQNAKIREQMIADIAFALSDEVASLMDDQSNRIAIAIIDNRIPGVTYTRQA